MQLIRTGRSASRASSCRTRRGELHRVAGVRRPSDVQQGIVVVGVGCERRPESDSARRRARAIVLLAAFATSLSNAPPGRCLLLSPCRGEACRRFVGDMPLPRIRTPLSRSGRQCLADGDMPAAGRRRRCSAAPPAGPLPAQVLEDGPGAVIIRVPVRPQRSPFAPRSFRWTVGQLPLPGAGYCCSYSSRGKAAKSVMVRGCSSPVRKVRGRTNAPKMLRWPWAPEAAGQPLETPAPLVVVDRVHRRAVAENRTGMRCMKVGCTGMV